MFTVPDQWQPCNLPLPAYHYPASSGDTHTNGESQRSFLTRGLDVCLRSWPYYSKQRGKGRDKRRPQTVTSWVLINCSKPLQIRETSRQIAGCRQPLSSQIILVVSPFTQCDGSWRWKRKRQIWIVKPSTVIDVFDFCTVSCYRRSITQTRKENWPWHFTKNVETSVQEREDS